VIAGIILKSPLFGVGFSFWRQNASGFILVEHMLRFCLGPVVLFVSCFFGTGALSAQMPMPSTTWHNPDGSHRLALEFAGGVTPTIGSQRKYQMRGWTYRMGGGFRFSRHMSLLAEYSYSHFDVPSAIANAGNMSLTPTAGDVHLWSTTLAPTYEYFRRNSFAAYAVVASGFYRKLTIFRPADQTCNNKCAPQPDYARYSNNAGGIEGGLGFTKELTESDTAKFFAEIRYVWVDNEPHSTEPYYLPAAQRTSYVPITAGIRW
jgi:hypothetical protein